MSVEGGAMSWVDIAVLDFRYSVAILIKWMDPWVNDRLFIVGYIVRGF